MANAKRKEEWTSNTGVSGERILQYIERIEVMEDEKSLTAATIRDIYAEAKAEGFDAPTIRKMIADRRKPEDKLQEQYALFELYSAAIKA